MTNEQLIEKSEFCKDLYQTSNKIKELCNNNTKWQELMEILKQNFLTKKLQQYNKTNILDLTETEIDQMSKDWQELKQSTLTFLTLEFYARDKQANERLAEKLYNELKAKKD